MNIQDLLTTTVKQKASDLHLLAGYPPTLRLDGELKVIAENYPLVSEDISSLLEPTLNSKEKKLLLENRQLDYAYEVSGIGRFRVNAYFQKETLAAAFRHIPYEIRTLEALNLPPILGSLTQLKQGFVLITGPTGHGKTTTMASLVNRLNLDRPVHIITLEDPIEYIYKKGKALISQREMGADTLSWPEALRAAIRQDPDVVLIGEMRDYETIAAALTVAETGHLVFASLHTNSASQSIDRIIDVMPPQAKAQARFQLSATLEAVVSQRLVPALGGGRVPAVEILLSTPAVRNVIREKKTYQIDNLIQTSAGLGMQTLEDSLAFWVKQGKIELAVAEQFASRPQDVSRAVKGQ